MRVEIAFNAKSKLALAEVAIQEIKFFTASPLMSSYARATAKMSSLTVWLCAICRRDRCRRVHNDLWFVPGDALLKVC